MKLYTILRIPTPRTRGAGPAPLTAGTDASIELERIDAPGLRDLKRDPAVAAAAPVMRTKLIAPIEPPKTPRSFAAITWGLVAIQAHESPFNGAGVPVAVLDTGIDEAHTAFSQVELVEADFTGDGKGDPLGHGTHCAGTLFGRDVDGTRIGVARGVTNAFIGKVIKHDGSGDSNALFRGLHWAVDKGARVISMSLGFDFPGMVVDLVDQGWPVELATSAALEAYGANLRMFDAIMEVIRARRTFDGGAVVVAAAGNESRRNLQPEFAIAASIPAAAKGVISVGALERSADSRLRIAPFSNRAPEISAPGCDVVSARAGGTLVSLNGTSMAAPHVAGVAALWWQALAAQKRLPNATTVAAKLVAEARTDVFHPDVDISDRGEGLVTAPRG